MSSPEEKISPHFNINTNNTMQTYNEKREEWIQSMERDPRFDWDLLSAMTIKDEHTPSWEDLDNVSHGVIKLQAREMARKMRVAKLRREREDKISNKLMIWSLCIFIIPNIIYYLWSR